MQQRYHLQWASPRSATASLLALILSMPLAWAGDEASDLAMPQAVSDTPFASEREAVIWRREELKDIESLVRQLRFDLINNQDIEAATPRLLELQERASAQRLLPAFIEGTHGSGSEARASIWEEWDQFAAGFTDLEDKIANLIEVAEQQEPRDTARALSEVGASCKSCHRAYRYD
ncbi:MULTISPECIES: c-type cytochrome [unclassified Halomonas]|uniref:c-type cytochrome n=1 Tax=unclassified Halomonas TaxID=2609666 RepID=UPI001CF4E257|nr:MULTISPECIES: cytochrome c [unclassified Halomonas]MCA8865244.1 cytochrome c [Halomonas sp. SBBP1]UZH12203.1 cytochrome c [Halomonas sp. BDJS001]